MKLLVSTEARFIATPDGCTWSSTNYTYPFWTRYLSVFDEVQIVARVEQVVTADSDWQRADGDHIKFLALPDWRGPVDYLRHFVEVRQILRQAVTKDQAFMLRLPSVIGSNIYDYLTDTNYPYGVEVVGDPYDVFAPGSINHPARRFFRWWFPKQLSKQCHDATAASYVTADALQKRYPASDTAFSTYYSDVELEDDAFMNVPRDASSFDEPFKLVFVGSLAHMHKGADVLIDAFKLLVQEGLDVQLTFVGDGAMRKQLEKQTTLLGLQEQIQFIGSIPGGEPVRDQLRQADLFVLPSRHEGLPRAIIEAMAMALPVVSTNIAGIPELISSSELVEPSDAEALAVTIRKVLLDKEYMARLSAENLDKARNYHETILEKRRLAFYEYMEQVTRKWQAHNGA